MVFESSTIGNIRLKNRIVRSATWEGMADDAGNVTDKLLKFYKQLGEGDLGVVISGHAYVSPEGKASPGQLGIDTDDRIDGLSRIASLLHDHETPAILQIAHGGAFSLNGDQQPLTDDLDTEKIISDFTDAAERSRRAGFDGVQIHAAHGYLLSQFLSPLYNKRTDSYGGDLENRFRIIGEIIENIRGKLDDFPVFIKINSEDFHPEGLQPNETIEAVRRAEEMGVDCIEISGGTQLKDFRSPVPRGDMKSEDQECYYRDAAFSLKQTVSLPLILVGGIRSYSVAEQMITENRCDYISLSRPLISEPGLAARWHRGDMTRSRCVSCNRCFVFGFRENGIRCKFTEPV